MEQLLLQNTFKAGVAGESSQASGAPTPPQSSIDPASELARVIRDRNRLRDSLARVCSSPPAPPSSTSTAAAECIEHRRWLDLS